MLDTTFKTCVCLLVISVMCVAQETRESRIVQTPQGPVRGYKTDGVYYFYGIPYATAPTGSRRFTAPLPGPVWITTFEAVNSKIMCPQGKHEDIPFRNFDIREDCLVANVYMPDTEETNLPVVVYVHGGGFQVGVGSAWSPNALVRTKKVIAVTFNYRLGAHGFLCLGTENAPGNAGLKDQISLLQWVEENIISFGGNPNEVTIAGYSAGAASVDLLMLSKRAEGLFKRVISESGAGMAVWGVQLDPIQNAKDFAKQLNFIDVDNIRNLEEFFTSLSFEALVSDTFMDRKDSTFMFSPCVDHDILADSPLSILKQGKYRKIEVLYGFAKMDGLFRKYYFEQWNESMNERFSDFLPADLQFKNDVVKEKLAHEIKEFYFGDKLVSEDTVQGYIDYFTDIMFAYPQLRSVKLQVKAGSDSIYLYEYSFFRPLPNDNHLPEYLRKIKRVGHCAQTFIIQDSTLTTNLDCAEKENMKKIMVDLWVNFITTGNPIPKGQDHLTWPPVAANTAPYMELGEVIKLHNRPLLEKRANFWDDIYNRYYKSPLPPCISTPSKVKNEL